ncbi:MAG: hypothetical protein WD939_09645 [Dehalococcoidia bacterium]
MSEGVAIKERRRRATSHCQHRWVIETPHGATSRGLCKRCGATKRFPNAAEDAMNNPTGGLGRWSGRRDLIRPKGLKVEDKKAGG